MSESGEFSFLECQDTGIFYLDDDFPKKCGLCGMMYSDHADFVKRTKEPQKGVFVTFNAGLVMEYRHCKCGSTLVCMVKTRRDLSAEGDVKRQEFDDALNELVADGIPVEEARKTILEIILYVRSVGIYKAEDKRNRQESVEPAGS